MTEQEFVEAVMMELPKLDTDNYEDIAQLYHFDFTVSDAIRYALCWEEVSPSMNEDRACKRMGEIGRKYRKYVQYYKTGCVI